MLQMKPNRKLHTISFQMAYNVAVCTVGPLKENCNVKTTLFHLKGRSKSCKIRPKSLKSAKPYGFEIFNFKDRDLDKFTRKNNRKTENVVSEVLHKLKNNSDVEMINAPFNNKQSRIFPSVDLIRT